MSCRCNLGQWVEIRWTAMASADRATNIPEETRRVPLEARVKGFAQSEASIGEELEVRTVTGRLLRGELLAINPAYSHSFGSPQPELLAIGVNLKGGK